MLTPGKRRYRTSGVLVRDLSGNATYRELVGTLAASLW